MSTSTTTSKSSGSSERIFLLDYGAGNVLSVQNALQHVGAQLEYIHSAADFEVADKLIFPGVGAFGACMEKLEELGYVEPLKKYLASGKPYLGICLGLQTLFEASEENPGVKGLGVIPATITKFDASKLGLAVPEIGWNGVNVHKASKHLETNTKDKFYFVHSYLAENVPQMKEWVLATTNYGIEFVSVVEKGNIVATQFHPEKSGKAGLALLKRFFSPSSTLDPSASMSCTTITESSALSASSASSATPTQLAPRIIACLDVRSNDQGDLVVTKGDQYDVREKTEENAVRNLGKPVQLAQSYYEQGADEVVFLNITSFRNSPLKDQPMLDVLRNTSKNVFVPLTIGGGIRDTEDPDGTKHTALEVASEYFRSGADKVSIGSDAVKIAEQFIKTGTKDGTTSIEEISRVYGAQAVVISVDPRRVYVNSPDDTPHTTIKQAIAKGPHGEEYCWYQCTIHGGRTGTDLDAHQLVKACEALGAGEIMLNCIDKDGTNSGYDLELVKSIKESVSIPVIASSGAGKPEHFVDVLRYSKADAALAAGIFHRKEVPIATVKAYVQSQGIDVRQT